MAEPQLPGDLNQREITQFTEELHSAFKGLGTDEQAVIDIFRKITPRQAVQLAHGYKAAYGSSLVDKAKSELGGQFGNLVRKLLMSEEEIDADRCRESMGGAGCDEEKLIQVFSTKSGAEILLIKHAYKELYGADLESVVKKETTGKEEKLFVGFLQANRNNNLNDFDADRDVEILYNAGSGKIGTDESAINALFTTRGPAVLRRLFDNYEKKHDKSVEKVIKSEYTGKLEKLVLELIAAARDPNQYIAGLIDKSMKGMGTDEESLAYLIARYRSPHLLGPIAACYRQTKGKSLIESIKGETTGKFEKLLVSIVKNALEKYEQNPNFVPATAANLQQNQQMNTLGNDSTLHSNQRITAQNGTYLSMQGDGNLVLYTSSNQVLWATNTGGHPGPHRLVMQGDGNLVLFCGNSIAWASYTTGKGRSPYRLVLQEDSNLVIYDGNNHVMWSIRN